MKNNLVDEITKNRAAFLEVLIAVILMGICASISASLVYEKFKEHSGYLLAGTLMLLFFCIILLAKKLGKARNAKLTIHAFFVLNPKENSLYDVPRYDYSEGLYRYLKGAFKENVALKNQWEKEPIDSAYQIDPDSKKSIKRTPAASKLIKEATEYYILDKLSTHLTDYFNQGQYSESELKKYSRKDVPDILLSNRFMELFTNSMENRDAFNLGHDSGTDGAVVMAMGRGGAIYHRFDLTLPAKSIVSRSKKGEVIIDTENFVLAIDVDFDGFGYVTPRGFNEYYLGVSSYEESSEYSISIKIDVKFKLLSLIRNAKWDYYSWLDGFLYTLNKKMSGEMFFEKIQWNIAYTMIQCGEISKISNKIVNKGA